MNDDEKIIQNIRYICASMVQKANSGHPGTPLALTPLFHILYGKILHIHKNYLDNMYRDILILSNGHSCAVQYTLLTLHDILKMNDLKNFRQLNSETPGHPEYSTPGIEMTTGPLGQGLANGIGYAISLKKIKSPAKVYVIFGDGCYQEGISHESFGLVANLNLDNLIFIYDNNKVTIDGSTDLSMNENIFKRFESYNFEIFDIDGENLDQIYETLKKPQMKPKMIILNTKIASGCSRIGDYKTHGAPLGQEIVDELKNDFSEFEFDKITKNFYKNRQKKNEEFFESIQKNILENIKKYDFILKENNSILKSIYKNFKKEIGNKATREYIPEILDEFKKILPIIGGSADLTPSTLTRIKNEEDFNKNNYDGTFIRFGIREHAMFAIQNGITAHGYFRSFGSTFLIFLTYGFPAIRLAALSKIPNLYLLTHDSIGVGEDGPTHIPIELLSLCRSLPNLYVFRPCNNYECRFSIYFGLTQNLPTIVCFSRQKIKKIENYSEEIEKGAYFIKKNENSKLSILATGSEISIALDVCNILEKNNISCSVISFLSFKLFDIQDEKYKNYILNKDSIKISIEAASTFGWSKYVDYSFGVDNFGVSAKASDAFEYFEMVPEKISEKIINLYFSK